MENEGKKLQYKGVGSGFGQKIDRIRSNLVKNQPRCPAWLSTVSMLGPQRGARLMTGIRFLSI